MPTYNKGHISTPDHGDPHLKTIARIQNIRSHISNIPRGTRLKGKVCIITGAGSLKGIGRATAIRFAHEGAEHLYLVDFDPTNFPNLKSTIKTKYPDVKITTVQADAANESAISEVCNQALCEEGRLDVFFANAGIASNNLLPDISTEGFMNMIRVNTLSCFLAVKYASAAMEKVDPARGKARSGGSVIMTASIGGLRSGAGTIDYSASKAAVNSIAKTSAYQLRETDIRVNTICPGITETGMTHEGFERALKRGTAGRLGQLNPLGRYGIPEEVAQIAVFLASDDSSYVNGQNIPVDGGLSASHPVVPRRLA